MFVLVRKDFYFAKASNWVFRIQSFLSLVVMLNILCFNWDSDINDHAIFLLLILLLELVPLRRLSFVRWLQHLFTMWLEDRSLFAS